MEKMLWENCSSEDLIAEIKGLPVIWNTNHEEYHYKSTRDKAWLSVVEHCISNFNQLSNKDKFLAVGYYKKRWKGIKDSYLKEKTKQQKGYENTRKTYVHYNQLTFLESIGSNKKDNIGSDEDQNVKNCDAETKIKKTPVSLNNDRKQGKINLKKRKGNGDDVLENFLKILQAKYRKEEMEKKSNDDDKLFLLSLHSDLRSLPNHLKLNVKSKIIGILAEAQQNVCTSSRVEQIPTFLLQNQLHTQPFVQQQLISKPSNSVTIIPKTENNQYDTDSNMDHGEDDFGSYISTDIITKKEEDSSADETENNVIFKS